MVETLIGKVASCATVVSVLLVLTGCGAAVDETPDVVPELSTTRLLSTSSSTTTTPTSTPTPEIALDCFLDDSFETEQAFTIVGELDFSNVWAQAPYDCTAVRNDAPLSTVEQKAFDASGYGDPDITTLYSLCAEVDPTDVYASGGHVASEDQVKEINAVLILCPDHPLAAEMATTAERGLAEIELGRQGRLFGPGTYLVGDEIQPGKYFTEADEAFDNCYWERTDRAGNIIDNNFSAGAMRVEVKIMATDYSFHSEDCGTWRPR